MLDTVKQPLGPGSLGYVHGPTAMIDRPDVWSGSAQLGLAARAIRRMPAWVTGRLALFHFARETPSVSDSADGEVAATVKG